MDRNRDDVKISRLMFTEWLLQNEQEIISIDESGFHLWLSRSRGRARQGQRALRIVGARKGSHFSFILAVSNQRAVIHHMIHNGGTNIERFNLFIGGSWRQRPTRILIGQCQLSGRRAAEAMIPGHHVVRHLPAYLPFLNIYENAFSVWNSQLKRDLTNIPYMKFTFIARSVHTAAKQFHLPHGTAICRTCLVNPVL